MKVRLTPCHLAALLLPFLSVAPETGGDRAVGQDAGNPAQAGIQTSDPIAKTEGLPEYLKRTDLQINRMMAAYGNAPRNPLVFGCNLVLAHGGIINRVPVPVLLKSADALKEAGAQRIEMNPLVKDGGDPRAARKYKAVIEHIRALGLQIAINPESADPAIAGISNFDTYQKAALAAYAQWASDYKPDHFVLVHEPTTMAARMHIHTTPEQWRGFIEATAKAVKQASPRTRIGAGCFAGLTDREIPFFQEFSTIPELEFLTLDNYVGTPRAIATMDQMVKIAGGAQKPLYMEETWRPHFLRKGQPHMEGKSMESISAIGFGWAGFESLDERWIQAMTLYAATHGMESVTVFQTRCFFLYVTSGPTDGPVYEKQVEQAVLENKHTQTLEAFLQYTKKFGHL